MGINVNIQHVEYMTPSKTHGKIAECVVKNLGCENDLKTPFSFSWTLINSPLDFFSRIEEHYQAGKQRLTVIMDYQPLCGLADTEKKMYYEVLRDTILYFPEYDFVFDETFSEEGHNFLHFLWRASTCDLFGDCIDGSSKYFLDASRHTFRFLPERDDVKSYIFVVLGSSVIGDEKLEELKKKNKWNPFKEILLGHHNLFDSSNLRYYLKEEKYLDLNLVENFSSLQSSRAEKLAICVEEERSQSLFNSVALYLNGFRVLPITSSSELKKVNEFYKVEENIKWLPKVVIRDYDLQFPDAPPDNIQTIRETRVWNYDESTNQWTNLINKDNTYWSELSTVETYFISKGFESKANRRVLSFQLPGTQPIEECCFNKRNGTLKLPGIDKPVSGLYEPFRKIPTIRHNYDAIAKIEDSAPISTRRREVGGHGVPLDLYNMVKGMVDRAEYYFENERYIHAIIVSSEAIEVMNGFHQALTLRAYRCQALAENAAAANVLGTSEKELAKDTTFRLRRIEATISRLSSLGDNKKKKRKNTLNQIFNDIRVFCQDKEHFLAEDAVVREIGHLNEGIF